MVADGAVAGAVVVEDDGDAEYRHARLDVFLGSASQGRGLGREAVSAVARHLRDDAGHHRLTADPCVLNVRAVRTFERVGFRRVGLLRAYQRIDGETWLDGLLMELLGPELRT